MVPTYGRVQVFKVDPYDSLDFLGVCFYAPFMFLILLILIFSLCLLVSLDKSLSVLLVFSKNKLSVLQILLTVLFVSILVDFSTYCFLLVNPLGCVHFFLL